MFIIYCFSINLFFGGVNHRIFSVHITLKHLKHPGFVLLGAQCWASPGGSLSYDRGHLTTWGVSGPENSTLDMKSRSFVLFLTP